MHGSAFGLLRMIVLGTRANEGMKKDRNERAPPKRRGAALPSWSPTAYQLFLLDGQVPPLLQDPLLSSEHLVALRSVLVRLLLAPLPTLGSNSYTQI
jgi:hypothetical protein